MVNVICCEKEYSRYEAEAHKFEDVFSEEQQELVMESFDKTLGITFPIIATWRRILRK